MFIQTRDTVRKHRKFVRILKSYVDKFLHHLPYFKVTKDCLTSPFLIYSTKTASPCSELNIASFRSKRLTISLPANLMIKSPFDIPASTAGESTDTTKTPFLSSFSPYAKAISLSKPKTPK